jgi:hypothetical protein
MSFYDSDDDLYDHGESTAVVMMKPSPASQVAAASMYAPMASFVGVVSRTPVNYNSRLAPKASKAAPSLRDKKPDTVTYFYDLNVNVDNLLKQPDGGRELVLEHGNGIKKVVYSNPLHQNSEGSENRDCDIICGDICFKSANNLGEMLNVSTSVPAPSGFHDNVAEPTEKAPHGFLNADVPHGGEVTLNAELSLDACNFVENYPGQTAEDQDRMVYATNEPNVAHISVVPRAATLSWYNEHQDVEASGKQITEKHADVKGKAYADLKAAFEAKELCKAAIRKEIGYCNVTDPLKQTIRISVPGVPTRVAGGKTVMKQASLVETIIAATQAAEKNLREQGRIAGAKTVGKDVKAINFRVHGSVTYPYHKISPDFA